MTIRSIFIWLTALLSITSAHAEQQQVGVILPLTGDFTRYGHKI